MMAVWLLICDTMRHMWGNWSWRCCPLGTSLQASVQVPTKPAKMSCSVSSRPQVLVAAACRAGQSVRKRHQQALSFCVALWSLWMEMDQNCKNHSPKLPNIYCTNMLYMFTLTFEWLNSLCIKLPRFDHSSFFGADPGATVEMAQQLWGRPYLKSFTPWETLKYHEMEGARSSSCSKMPAGRLPATGWCQRYQKESCQGKGSETPNTKQQSSPSVLMEKGNRFFFLVDCFLRLSLSKKWNVLENWPAFLTHTSHNLSQVPDVWFFASWFTNEPERSRVSEFHQAVNHSLVLRSFAGWAMWCPAPHLSFFGTRMNYGIYHIYLHFWTEMWNMGEIMNHFFFRIRSTSFSDQVWWQSWDCELRMVTAGFHFQCIHGRYRRNLSIRQFASKVFSRLRTADCFTDSNS